MTQQNSGSQNQMAVPEAKAAMSRFKEEVASELGVPLKEGYNGRRDLAVCFICKNVGLM